jgi:hypothetical protein
MAHNDDPENQRSLSEETPLIGEHQPENSGDSTDEPKSELQASWYIWRVLWALLAALILAVFIKGWIDAGSDVNVSSPSYIQILD